VPYGSNFTGATELGQLLG